MAFSLSSINYRQDLWRVFSYPLFKVSKLTCFVASIKCWLFLISGRAGGHCHHMFALLYLLTHWSLLNLGEIPADKICTTGSLPQAWSVPRGDWKEPELWWSVAMLKQPLIKLKSLQIHQFQCQNHKENLDQSKRTCFALFESQLTTYDLYKSGRKNSSIILNLS